MKTRNFEMAEIFVCDLARSLMMRKCDQRSRGKAFGVCWLVWMALTFARQVTKRSGLKVGEEFGDVCFTLCSGNGANSN